MSMPSSRAVRPSVRRAVIAQERSLGSTTTRQCRSTSTRSVGADRPRQAPPPSPPGSSPYPSPSPAPRSTPSSLYYPISFLPSPSNDPTQGANPAPLPSTAALARATSLFTAPPARFLYAAPRFLDIPRNSYVPEVCLLGRSNVGKSTLVNALAGASGSVAGRSHPSAVAAAAAAQRSAKGGGGSSRSSRSMGIAGPAITSARAGSTRTMNAYGFGPPPQLPKHTDDEDGNRQQQQEQPPQGSAHTRRERREARAQREAPPRHSLVLMDMPGYGLHSRAEWGREVAKYLTRRAALRGAVLLVDAVTGPKEGDRMALAMLRDAGVRTAVALTKADKLGYGIGIGSGSEEKGARAVREACLRVWEELRGLEVPGGAWTEGGGWEREIWVTGAGDPRNGRLGVEGVRLAVCRMAGLVEDERRLEAVARLGSGGGGGGRIVSFDELYAAGMPRDGNGTTRD